MEADKLFPIGHISNNHTFKIHCGSWLNENIVVTFLVIIFIVQCSKISDSLPNTILFNLSLPPETFAKCFKCVASDKTDAD